MAHVIQPVGISAEATFGAPHISIQTRTGLHSSMHWDLNNTFFNTDEFAVTVQYEHQSGKTTSYRGIFDNEYASVNPGTMVPTISTNPQLTIMESSCITKCRQGDVVYIKGVHYIVITVEPDGVGCVTLMLQQEDR